MEGKTKYKAKICYKIIQENFVQGNFYTTITQYVISFLLDKIKFDLEKGIKFEPLIYPTNL